MHDADLGTGKDMKEAERQAHARCSKIKQFPAKGMETSHRNMGAYSPKPWATPNLEVCLVFGSSLSPPPVSSPDVPKQDPMWPS